MFDWLLPGPRCPVDTQEKAWIEWRMLWLSEQFGRERLLSAVFAWPDDRHFPDPHESTPTGARRLLDRLCQFMGVEPGSVDLEFGDTPAQPKPTSRRNDPPSSSIQLRPGGVAPWSTGIQESPAPTRHAVRLTEELLGEPMLLAAALTYELARGLLQGRLSPLEDDYEFVADLLPVYFGTGVFAANVTIHAISGHEGQMSWWRMSRHGHLTSQALGYAMALFAWVRGEASPAWANSLREDAAGALRNGLRYLRKTGDSLFRQDTFGVAPPVRESSRADEIMARLDKGTASARLAALWEVREQALLGPEWVEAVAQRLGDRDPAVAAEAAHVLAGFGEAAAPKCQRLREALRARDTGVRAAAATALGELRFEPAAVVPELCLLLEEADDRVFLTAAMALARYAAPIEPAALKLLMARIDRSFADGRDDVVEAVARALLATVPEPERCVREYFTDNKEWRQLALTALAEFREEKELDPWPKPSEMASDWE